MSGNIISKPSAKKPKAIALLSGGLDSVLAIKSVLEQGIEVTALNFSSPFCTCSSGSARGCSLAVQSAKELGIKIKVLEKGIDYIRVIENPKFGYGKGINPCIDCRIYMLKQAASFMNQTNAQFIVTGEVLGQRPMSQRQNSIKLIETESGLTGKILRPLSARLLEPSIPEQDGTINRDLLMRISGRGRKAQLRMAKEKNIHVFGCPAGGCLLTDQEFSRRLHDIFDHTNDWEMREIKLAAHGRHFRLNKNLKIVFGRNEHENKMICDLAADLPIIRLKDVPGPSGVVCGIYSKNDLPALGRIIQYYSRKKNAHHLKVLLQDGIRKLEWCSDIAPSQKEITAWRI